MVATDWSATEGSLSKHDFAEYGHFFFGIDRRKR